MTGLHAYGEAVFTAQSEALRQEADAHPTWTDRQILQSARQRGARYLPGDEDVENRLRQRLLALTPFIGEIAFRELRFELRSKQQLAEHLAAAQLFWSGTVDVRAAPDLPSTYHVTFEPFGGNLIDLRPWNQP